MSDDIDTRALIVALRGEEMTASEAVKHYCTNIRIDIPHVDEVDDEAVMYNIRAMAFMAGDANGYQRGKAEERQRIKDRCKQEQQIGQQGDIIARVLRMRQIFEILDEDK